MQPFGRLRVNSDYNVSKMKNTGAGGCVNEHRELGWQLA
jgi:hypothetical protein